MESFRPVPIWKRTRMGRHRLYTVKIIKSDHAGTTPIGYRKDAVVWLRNSMFRMASERKRFLKGFVRTFSTLDSLAKKAEMRLGFHNGWVSNLLRWIWIRESDF
ncbi:MULTISPECIES: hypothetical protein [Peribacillus]|uniref:hypothetical protein n=1 Tax=Peribacillus TaxID=2675229 RepID=UPI001F50038B|nr:hypothetical protein [Peribacillus frigoritolerans]MCK2019236.1 hypothetical protein [Peribacillus frigoritolerans]MEB2490227.1 hypothetical protein [Peribacillus frigoritolerans]